MLNTSSIHRHLSLIAVPTASFLCSLRAQRTRSLAVDHTPLLSAPHEVVNIIKEANQMVSS